MLLILQEGCLDNCFSFCTTTIIGPFVGILIGVIQAATNPNEMTLSFIPKLMALAFAIFVFGSWQIGTLLIILNKFLKLFRPYLFGICDSTYIEIVDFLYILWPMVRISAFLLVAPIFSKCGQHSN